MSIVRYRFTRLVSLLCQALMCAAVVTARTAVRCQSNNEPNHVIVMPRPYCQPPTLHLLSLDLSATNDERPREFRGGVDGVMV